MSKALTPEVTWAQRSSTTDSSRNWVFLTISAPDVPKSSLKLDIQPSVITFSGHSDSKKTDYSVTLNLFADIDPSQSHVNHSSRAVELKLQKKEKTEEYWPRLLKDKAKQHFLKTDFDKWVDEDEQDAVEDEDPMGGAGAMGGMDPSMMGAGGGMGGLDFSKLGGMGGMGGGGGEGGMDFAKMMEQMGGAGGMGGAGMPGMGGDDDEDDDEMPDLEDEDEAAASSSSSSKPSGSAKIEEVE